MLPRPSAVPILGGVVPGGGVRAVHLAPPVDAAVVLAGDGGVDVQKVGRQDAAAPLEIELHGAGARVAGYALHVGHGYTLTIAWLQMACVSRAAARRRRSGPRGFLPRLSVNAAPRRS